jgi:hypothetical protein
LSGPHRIELPEDWRKFHLDNVRSIRDRAKVAAAVEFLRAAAWFADLETYRGRIEADPEWWAASHFAGMMAVRNELRGAGFGEEDLGVDNLDDYAVGLVELALGLTTL